ncbi:mediator of RNA polymerase II transcription complex subunit 8-domain-containing protein [Durotheca rogersii]|uniref:mediator of RNA polymerase II transcription complex subunit 8-domain-containing protein n=1 Tax=Durotheca rogersii TaxID=419775 RepID=UPI00221E3825|nr:mediator of RNA polymerase II transcription complex subunit 8-domain-containing protein [Durotheca rogersii]KAI5865715.1 mediator of RNA polymerase II transcription complex subunit 8-domain-containing protein [Durotheca rogersii]
MASLDLSPEELKAVEQTRQRLSQISESIASVKAGIFASNPLPQLSSLQASADILQHNLRMLLEINSQHNELFSRIAVHPSTNFPGRTQESILLQLLRKKPEPDIATAMDEGRRVVAGLTSPAHVAGEAASSEDAAKELEDKWTAANSFLQKRLYDYLTKEDNDPYTKEERELGIENVRAGLRRPLEEDEEDEDEDEDEEKDDDIMEIDRPPPPPAPAVVTQEVEGATVENIMRFASRGEFVAG